MVRDLVGALGPLEAKDRSTAILTMVFNSGLHRDWMITTTVACLTDAQIRVLMQSSKDLGDILTKWSADDLRFTMPRSESPERPGAQKRVEAIVNESR